MTKILTSLKKLIGRIKKMKIWREVVLISFGFLFSILFPATAELINFRTWQTVGFEGMTFVLTNFIIVSIFAGLLLYIARKIDINEQEKEDKKYKQFVKDTVAEIIDAMSNVDREKHK